MALFVKIMQVFEFPLQITHRYMRTTLHGTLKSDRLFSDEVSFLLSKFFTWVKFLSHSCGWFFLAHLLLLQWFTLFFVYNKQEKHLVFVMAMKESAVVSWRMGNVRHVRWPIRSGKVCALLSMSSVVSVVGGSHASNEYCFGVKLNLARVRFGTNCWLEWSRKSLWYNTAIGQLICSWT